MDAPEQDRDVIVQRHSADLITDFDRSLGPFLRKPNGQLRSRVRFRETGRLMSQLLEPFQELPQLLDPQLPKWLPVLADAYLQCLRDRHRTRSLSMRSQLLQPLSEAICKLIYTFCKIRGEKIVVRFLNVEAKYLEVLLSAIEDAGRVTDAGERLDSAVSWAWHERYVVLIWLSQLFYAPFDLSTISSGDMDDLERTTLPGFDWPPQVPGITLRVIPLTTKYLASPGKERDGAKALLVRLAMRRDMQEAGILRALIGWTLSTLRAKSGDEAQSPYYYIGSLSFLAGLLGAAADTSIMDEYLSAIFYATQAISTDENTINNVITGSALARKMLIKVIRSVITLILRKPQQSMADTEMVETTIGYLLERLADNDTPVRLAASKALSVITLKLDLDMASQVIDAVLQSLNRNVLWVKNKADPDYPPSRDLTAVDPLEWHGLMLTLSHLLYRRSPPPDDLSEIVHALLMGLSFEKRNPSGGTIGTNVRDASCFGIWALARRYTTAELLRVTTKAVLVASGHDPSASILQVMATELVVTASLDPAGNIRRGASAALQELIGRHPDTVEKGIAVVQKVDYHAVALRTRAIHEVALEATRLSSHYGNALLVATLGWRGIGDVDAGARRVSASSYGALTAEMASSGRLDAPKHIQRSIRLLLSRLRALQPRQVEERHGLLLSLAAVFDIIPSLANDTTLEEQWQLVPLSEVCMALRDILLDSHGTKYRKPELVAEATGRLVVSSTPVLVMSFMARSQELTQQQCILHTGSAIVDETRLSLVTSIAGSVGTLQECNRPKVVDEILSSLNDNLKGWLDRNEVEVMTTASEAALILLVFLPPSKRQQTTQSWYETIRPSQGLRRKHGNGYFHAIARAYSLLDYSRSANDSEADSPSVSEIVTGRWSTERDIEIRVAILQSLVGRAALKANPAGFMGILHDGLDDYTTNARGDIGSHVRLEAIKATKTLWETQTGKQATMVSLFPRILRLAAEKLDRVRSEAQSALAMLLQSRHSEVFTATPCSSADYFSFLFGLCEPERLDPSSAELCAIPTEECMAQLLAGLVTSADTGNEDLVIASRATLAGFCGETEENLQQVCTGLLGNLKQHAGQDRVIVPTMEVMAYLFHMGLLRAGHDWLDMRQLCLRVQKAAYKTGNVRKVEAAIKVYSAVAATGKTVASELAQKRQEGIAEARRRLGALLIHPWPRVRNLVVDELWALLADDGDNQSAVEQDRQQQQQAQKLLGVDWGKAEKAQIQKMAKELGLQ